MRLTLFFLPLLVLLYLVFVTQTYRVKPKIEASPGVVAALSQLASKALAGREVPVGAVLVYHDSIIGVGYNTVVRDTLISGHAEINALNEAHRKNRAIWNTLDPAQMTLYSTYEPCEMCKGALINLHIGHVVFEGPKPLTERLKTTLKSWLFEAEKKRLDAPGLQEHFFRQHPDYKTPQ